MIPELSIIKLLCSYTEWCQFKDSISVKDFPKELAGIYRVLNAQHELHGVDITIPDLANYFFSTRPKDVEYYQTLFQNLETLETSYESTVKLIESVQVGKILREVSIDAYEVAEGKGNIDDLLLKLDKLRAKNEEVDQQDDFEFVTDDLTVLVDETIKTPGLRWRLQTLNKMLGSLRRGNFGFLFARPETGKTSFLASEVTYMASQLADDVGPVLWLSNEQPGNEVMLRVYQAALGIDLTELLRNLEANKKKFHTITKGKIKIYDSGNISKQDVEKLCKRLRPSLILFDQLDKIQGFANDREDLRLGTIYQWARELAKEYAPVIGVCQADGTGEGVKWLTMAHVSSAKTAKQAEADWILGIGKINDVGYDQLRYLHASKNKLLGDADTVPDLRHGRCEVLLDASISRYIDIQ